VAEIEVDTLGGLLSLVPVVGQCGGCEHGTFEGEDGSFLLTSKSVWWGSAEH